MRSTRRERRSPSPIPTLESANHATTDPKGAQVAGLPGNCRLDSQEKALSASRTIGEMRALETRPCVVGAGRLTESEEIVGLLKDRTRTKVFDRDR